MARGTWRRGTIGGGGGAFARLAATRPAPHDGRPAGDDPVDIGVALTIYRRDANGALVELVARREATVARTPDPAD